MPTCLLLVPTSFRFPSFNFLSREELEVENLDTDLEDKKNGVVVGLHFVTVFVGTIIAICHRLSSFYLHTSQTTKRLSLIDIPFSY